MYSKAIIASHPDVIFRLRDVLYFKGVQFNSPYLGSVVPGDVKHMRYLIAHTTV